ncbi:hypothetical protein [Photobacterium lipolyticum]|uniref:Chromosome partitioning protein ParA n=1 Tax=Photobacterium lipolyticum TaxID=266810 RepID=A0A2T3N4V3_9GAMM|nr:hypothetical protein [Photobacterium lipolyticum]PSW07460.1 hypothetical protein C9I89_01735 [Photobacterium lipolyticum]
MVSIHRLPPSINPQQKPRVSAPAHPSGVAQPTAVASAVSKSVRSPESIRDAHAHIQYDQPEGNNREALESYLGVMYQNKKDEFSNLMGVDVYV